MKNQLFKLTEDGYIISPCTGPDIALDVNGNNEVVINDKKETNSQKWIVKGQLIKSE